MGVEGFGQYGFVLAIISFFNVLGDFGLNQIQIRDSSVHQADELPSKLITTTFWARGFLGVLSLIAIITIALLSQKPIEVKLLLVIFGVSLFAGNLLGAFTAVLAAFERFTAFGIISSIYGFTYTFLGILALKLGYGLIGIGISQLIVSIAITFVGIIYVNFRVLKPTAGFDGAEIWRAIKIASPLGVTMMLTAIYYKADFVMLSYLRSDTEVGYYNSAYTVVNTLLLFAATLSGTLLPRLSALLASDREMLRRMYRIVFKYLLFIGVGCAFGALVLAKPMFQLVFGPEYLPGATALKILIWASALIFVNSLQGILLIASDMKKELLCLTATATAINIALNIILIPKFGFIGAAVTTVIAELVNGIWSFVLLRRHNPPSIILKLIPKILFSAGAMIGVVILIPGVNVIVRICIGAAIYLIVLTLLGGIERSELRGFKDVFRMGAA